MAVGVVLPAASGCATRPNPDEIVLYYQGGAGEDQKFQECIKPGTSGSYPVDDKVYTLPTSARTWNIRPDGGDSKDPIRTASKPTVEAGRTTQAGQEMSVYATADFYLNTDCTGGQGSPVVQFWEKTGRRFGLSTDGGDFSEDQWRRVLINTFVPAEEKAVREVSLLYNADDLDGNIGGTWAAMEALIAPRFNAELRAKVGGDYFCGAGYDKGKQVEWQETTIDPQTGQTFTGKKTGTCPPVRISITDINFARQDIADARSAVFRAEQEAKEAMIRAQSQVDVANTLAQAGRDPAYLRLKELENQLEAARACASNPNCTIIVAPAGTNVIAGTGK